MHPVTHFEIIGDDLDRLVEFYRATFGWQIEPLDQGYAFVNTRGGRGFNGGIGTAPPDAARRAGVTVYVAVPDIETRLERASELGAAVVTPVTEIPEVVTFAQFRDPEGNVVGLVQDAGSPPPVESGDGAPVTWFEIMGREASIQDFYRELFDWAISDEAPAPGYGTVGWEAWGFGGGIGSFPGVQEPYVTIYPEVQDVDETCKRILELGGSLRMDPTDMVEAGIRVAAFADPAGNLVGCYKQIGSDS